MNDEQFAKYQDIRSKIENIFNNEELKEVLEMLQEDIPQMNIGDEE